MISDTTTLLRRLRARGWHERYVGLYAVSYIKYTRFWTWYCDIAPESGRARFTRWPVLGL